MSDITRPTDASVQKSFDANENIPQNNNTIPIQTENKNDIKELNPTQHFERKSKGPRKNCEWFARGFCKHGKKCRNRHNLDLICPLYLIGFCPYGKDCWLAHPKIELPLSATNKKSDSVKCFSCNQIGHTSLNCPNKKKD